MRPKRGRAIRSIEEPTTRNLRTYVSSPAEPSWEELISVFKKELRGLKHNRSRLQDPRRLNIFSSLLLSYQDIVWNGFSIDLVAASLRQREFATRITNSEHMRLDCPSALSNAGDRYCAFMLLMKHRDPRTKRHISLVPTMDIDLCWHTHQLFPRLYREWCIRHLSRPINHDDTIGTGDLEKGLRETSLLWLDAYSEAYTSDDLKKKYFSWWRRGVGLVFPPYGIYMLRKGKELDQVRLIGMVLRTE